jgi:hypothetical protein
MGTLGIDLHEVFRGVQLEAPLPNALVADDVAPFGQNEFHITEAQAADVIQPNSVADDLGREAVPGVGGGLGRHPTIFGPAASFRPESMKLTMP